nr:pilus assembly protein [Actinomycetota bacterium]
MTAGRVAVTWSRWRLSTLLRSGDGGSAVVEFVTIGVLMLVPVVYLVVAMAGVQAAAFATESAAREAARIVVTADDEQQSQQRVLAAVGWALRDQGIEA